jgi:hypothetical protein
LRKFLAEYKAILNVMHCDNVTSLRTASGKLVKLQMAVTFAYVEEESEHAKHDICNLVTKSADTKFDECYTVERSYRFHWTERV